MIATAAHPGYAATNLQSHSDSGPIDLFMKLGNLALAQSLEDGALPTIYAALEDIPGDSYAGPGGLGRIQGQAEARRALQGGQGHDVARRLWDVSEELTGVRFPLGADATGEQVGAGSSNGAG